MKKYKFLLPSLLSLALLAGCSSSSGDKDGLSESDLNAGRDRFGNGSIPLAEGEGLFRDVHFDYDSSTLEGSARQDIDYNASVLKQHGDMKIILEGHCDERGTNEYNMALGAARAKAVERSLIALGIPSTRLDTISYGEEVPLSQGHDESAWAENRRVHFAGTQGGKH